MNKRIRYIIYNILLALIIAYHTIPYHYVTEELDMKNIDFMIKVWDKCPPDKLSANWQVSIKIVDRIPFSNKDVIGMCIHKAFGYDILLLREYWDLASEDNKYELFSHEMLHCILGVKHMKNTLMNEFVMNYSKDKIAESVDWFINQKCGK